VFSDVGVFLSHRSSSFCSVFCSLSLLSWFIWFLRCNLSVSQFAFPGSSFFPLRKSIFIVLHWLDTAQFERTDHIRSEINGLGMDEGCFFSCCDQNPMRTFTTVIPPRHPWVLHQTLCCSLNFFHGMVRLIRPSNTKNGSAIFSIPMTSVQIYVAKCEGKWLFWPVPDSVLFFTFLHCSVFCSLLSSQCLTCSIPW
jgi:hypothetical protein